MSSKFLIHALLTGSLFYASCGNNTVDTSNKAESRTISRANYLEVFAFHGTRQCETCKNMKANTRETLETYFKDQLKDSLIVFRIVDVDLEENAKLAEKFQATGTALMVNRVIDGKDHIEDLSDFAFDKANNAQEFIPELKQKITTLIQ